MKLEQNIKVLNHLKKKGSITALEAFKKYGIMRLSARIYDLRNKSKYQSQYEGMDIRSVRLSKTSKRGRLNFSKYVLG